MIGPAIYQKLISDATVTNIIGTRIYPNFIREPDKYDDEGSALFPQASYEVKNPQYDTTYTGNSGLVFADVTITVAALRYTQCETAAQSIVNSLDQQSGTWGGVQVSRVFFQDMDDATVTDASSEQILYYVKDITFNVVFYM